MALGVEREQSMLELKFHEIYNHRERIKIDEILSFSHSPLFPGGGGGRCSPVIRIYLPSNSSTPASREE
jgi:hypothetical protein